MYAACMSWGYTYKPKMSLQNQILVMLDKFADRFVDKYAWWSFLKEKKFCGLKSTSLYFLACKMHAKKYKSALFSPQKLFSFR